MPTLLSARQRFSVNIDYGKPLDSKTSNDGNITRAKTEKGGTTSLQSCQKQKGKKYEQNDACSCFRRVRRRVLVRVTDFEVADDGIASDFETAFKSAGTSRPARLHAFVHGRRTNHSCGVRPFGAGLLHLCVEAEGGAPGVVDRFSGDDDVGIGSGVAANNGGDLHTSGGFLESVNDGASEMSR